MKMRTNAFCNAIGMLRLIIIATAIVLTTPIAYAQQLTPRPTLTAKKVANNISIDGKLDEAVWKDAAIMNNFTEFRPTPFRKEEPNATTEVYLMYNNEGIYVGGHCYEATLDSVTRELIGRDGFGNNDFVGIIFDTYNDKINGFEYFITPLGEQMDAKATPNGEDFSWDAVWESAATLHNKGWDFEMFIPFAAIRFGKGTMQKWGLNIVRRRAKTGQQYAWATIDPTINGFLTQEGFWEGLVDIKPPLRLQLSPYVSNYTTMFSKVNAGEKKVINQVNGGLDIKYGLNQAFTIDMTLIPDFGQVQTDNRVLNLTPFEQQFQEQRPFFTEGLELFSKGNLFYSRRIGKNPYQTSYDYLNVNGTESVVKDPQETKVLNASKISGRMQNGLAIGVLNAVTNTQYATVQNSVDNGERKIESFPLTNYNMIVLDKTLKNNSSVSFVNTNVLRSGSQYDANVSMALFNLFDKKNTWNVGGQLGISNLIGAGENGKTITGYIHSYYFGKQSGRFNFNIWNDVANDKYSQNDMGYATNSNYSNTGFYAGYQWNKPKGWYNRLNANINGYMSYLVKAIDPLKQRNHMYQERFIAANFSGQTKKLWQFYVNANYRPEQNDYYEARSLGRVFKRASRTSFYGSLSTNDAKKVSGYLGLGYWNITQFKKGHNYTVELGGKVRFNQKFSVEHNVEINNRNNEGGFGKIISSGIGDSVFFTRRNRAIISNNLNFKYSFSRKMWLNCFIRHYWSGVNAKQVFFLAENGTLLSSNSIATESLHQNYNTFALNLNYTWQVANGSFLTVVWKDESDDFVSGVFERGYGKNIDRTFDANQTNSISVRFIYFIDYVTARKKWFRKP
jgi:hypothetical protein